MVRVIKRILRETAFWFTRFRKANFPCRFYAFGDCLLLDFAICITGTLLYHPRGEPNCLRLVYNRINPFCFPPWVSLKSCHPGMKHLHYRSSLIRKIVKMWLPLHKLVFWVSWKEMKWEFSFSFPIFSLHPLHCYSSNSARFRILSPDACLQFFGTSAGVKYPEKKKEKVLRAGFRVIKIQYRQHANGC